MKLSIRDFLCIERADLDIGSITLVAALNGAGKSTICRGVAQVLTGTPTFGIKKSEAGVLVRDGAPEGRISLSDGDSMAAITLPQADYVTTGEPLNATVYAAGLTNIMGLDAKKRAAALADYLGTEPTREHLEAAMKDAGFKAGVVEATWKAIQEDGWDGVLARAQEFGQKEKGKWEEATGEKGYGSKKGESWTPESWDDDLAQTSVETLQSNLTEAQNALDGALRNQGAEQSVIDNYKNIVSKGAVSDETLTELRDKVTAAREALEDLPLLSEGPLGGTCPHCGEKVHIIQDRKPGVTKYTLEKPGKTPSEKEVKERREQRREAEFTLAGAEKSLRQAEDIQRGYESAASTLAEIEGQETTDPAVIEDARQRVRRAEARINAKLAKERADKLHNSIRNNQTLIDILKPDGLRKRRMAFAVTEFNKERLVPLCKAAGWDAVELDHDLNLRYGGRVATEPMRSEAQVYRAHATLQLALAQIDGSSMVVLDRADCLDAAGRNGLFGMLKAAGIPALVGMMMNKPSAVPDLAAANMGRSYWIESGEAVELGAKEAA